LHTERETKIQNNNRNSRQDTAPVDDTADTNADDDTGDGAATDDAAPDPQGPQGPRANIRRPTTETRTYPISSAPAAVDGMLFVVADNAAFYALSSAPLDTEAPIALKPSIAVRGSDGQSRPQVISAQRPVLVPGKAPVVFTTEIDDPGSGVDPAGFRVTLNGTEIPRENVFFQPATGLLTAMLADVDPTKTVVLPDGVYTVGVLARDTRGNALTYSTSFTVDKSVPPPGEKRGRRGGRRGGAPRQDVQTPEEPAPDEEN
jgi:hypothetical protein